MPSRENEMCKSRSYRISPDTHLSSMGGSFYYERVTSIGHVVDQGYECSAMTSAYLSLGRSDILRNRTNDPLGSRGWKIHIALEDTNSDNTHSAWNCLVGIFIEERISLVKLIRSENVPLDGEVHPNERGRQITIYSQLDSLSTGERQRILQRINDVLVANDIEPARHSAVCRRIQGSSYLSYRHDGTSENYIAARGANSYNPLNAVDTYSRIRIEEPLCKHCCVLM